MNNFFIIIAAMIFIFFSFLIMNQNSQIEKLNKQLDQFIKQNAVEKKVKV